MSSREDVGRPPKDVMTVVKDLSGTKGLKADMEYVNRRAPSFSESLSPENIIKNRFQNLPVWNDSRVCINDRFYKKNNKLGDYVNASLVDGLERPNEYILCMGPNLPEHEELFWRMILHQRCTVVVLLANTTDNKSTPGPDKSTLVSTFWPASRKEKKYCNNVLIVKTLDVISGKDCDTYSITVVAGSEKHQTELLHYHQWTDCVNPTSTILPFIPRVKLVHQQMEMKVRKLEKDRPPSAIVLMCATGVHRAGMFAILDVCLRRIRNDGRVALAETVREIRRQRFGCIAKTKQYLALVEILVSHCIQSGMINAEDLVDEDGKTMANHSGVALDFEGQEKKKKQGDSKKKQVDSKKKR